MHVTGKWPTDPSRRAGCCLAPACLPTHHCARSACTVWLGTVPPASASRFSARQGAGHGGRGQTRRSSCQHRCRQDSGGGRRTAQHRCHSPCRWSSGHRLQTGKPEPMPLPQQARMSGKITIEPEKPATSWNWFILLGSRRSQTIWIGLIKLGQRERLLFSFKEKSPGVGESHSLQWLSHPDDKCNIIFSKNNQECGPIKATE